MTPRASASTRRSPPSVPARSSPPTRRCRPASTASRSTWCATTSPMRLDTAAPRRSTDRILALGAEDNPNIFNMAHMGLRLAQRANGVSQLHGEVSRDMFGGLWSGFDQREVPIGSVTNGVHAPHLGGARRSAELFGPAQLVGMPTRAAEAVRPHALGAAHRAAGTAGRRGPPAGPQASWLRTRRARSRAGLGRVRLRSGRADRRLRAPRSDLQASDPHAARSARLQTLLLDPEHPVQLVVAGKSHPADDGGKPLIQQIVRFADDPELRHRIVFLPDYDMSMAPLPLLGLRRVAQQSVAPARGLRHVRHEVGAQRRPQPLDP